MKKILIVIVVTLLHQGNFIVASDRIDQYKERFKAEQIHFLSTDMHDVESIKTMIATMYELDQEFRTMYIHDRNNHDMQNFTFEMDQLHTQMIKKMVMIHGWIKISTFGAPADNQAWLLVQHADHDQAFQAECLHLLSDLYQKDETNPKNYAYLYDRVALQSELLGMKQKYGTQYRITDDGTISLRPHDGTIEEMNLLRSEVGLCPIQEYFELIQRVYKK